MSEDYVESDEGGGNSGRESPFTVDEIPRGKLLPLNSRILTTIQLKNIAETLGLPTTGSTDEVRQLIEGKLQDEHDVTVHNVQVVVSEDTVVSVALSLVDESGVFLRVKPFHRNVKETSESDDLSQQLADAGAQLELELSQAQELLAKEKVRTTQLMEELHSATTAPDEVSGLKSKLKAAEEKAKRVWRLNCTQSREQEELLASKDDRIATLEAEIRKLKTVCRERPSSSSEESSSESEESLPSLPKKGSAPKLVRRGKAPPVEPFTGENPAVKLDDWLPILK